MHLPFEMVRVCHPSHPDETRCIADAIRTYTVSFRSFLLISFLSWLLSLLLLLLLIFRYNLTDAAVGFQRCSGVCCLIRVPNMLPANMPYAEYATCRICCLRICRMPNMPHAEYAACEYAVCRICHMPNMLPANMPYAEYATCRICCLRICRMPKMLPANMPHTEYATCRICCLRICRMPNMPHEPYLGFHFISSLATIAMLLPRFNICQWPTLIFFWQMRASMLQIPRH